MRLSKMFGLAALVALAAMAFIGASTASATGTALCKTHTGLVCPTEDRWESSETIHFANEGVVKLLSDLVDVLCLSSLINAEPLASGSPQSIHGVVSYSGCGTDAGHDNCNITIEEQPLFNLLKTGLDAGSLTAANGKSRWICEDIFGFIDLDCKYSTTGILLDSKNQQIIANKTPVNIIAGSFLCPTESSLDFTLKALTNMYILGDVPPEYTMLCKAHSTGCVEKDQVKSLHMATTTPPVLLNTVANIECEASLATATVLALAEIQKVDVTELTWKECHTQGAADNCTVTSKGLPTIDLDRTALNLGNATTLGFKVGIDCTVLGLIELDCIYGSDVTLQAEGALHKEGTGHGMFTASKLVLKKHEGGGHCPESVKWDALYEPLEHAYIVE